MAMKHLTKKERGDRLADARRWAKWGSRELSLALGQDKQYVSRIESGSRKRVDREEWIAIADLLAGRYDLADKQPEDVVRFLEGDEDWLPHLRLVGEDGALPSTPPEKPIPGYRCPKVAAA